ncbi:SDR family oxidoreductase [Clostridium sp. SM-530-WT-3G]|uniref:elongation factor P 5-aminopentanone reductase n=1 Tax=Clostridium sp. SM-530-WT-3G TaxID=2725303 RepID=UPI00145FBB7B|nr:SDR family oxidoreductase [Clostridium sp. SM-530-WT-3G]NME83215.1 SDR family oxidoreductase [Clostridium sp. SM-530-WT-3G]
MGKLIGKVALVTGASRGIGRAIAVELAKEGASIVINYSKDNEGAKETLEQVKKVNGYGVIIKQDISSLEGCKSMIDEIINTMGKVDILVNNAGISTIGLFMDAEEEDISRIINTNLMGPVYLTKYALQHMVPKRSGNIINISSMWGDVGASCEVLYSTTKGGLNLFTKSLAKELAMSNIRVNGIAPGVIDTKMNEVFSEEDRKSLEEEIPLGRFGTPEEIGKLAVFLASDDSSYITGQIIRADGGFI